MERFKLNIDIADAVNVNEAVRLAIEAMSRRPDQDIGYVDAQVLEFGSSTFVLVRNLDSYTIRET